MRLRFCADLQAIPTPGLWINAVSLALFPTIVSLVTMAAAIRAIGSTPTAILGALEPLTALFFGVVVFGERLTPRIVLGVVLILVAVTLIIAGRSLHIPFPHLRFRRARWGPTLGIGKCGSTPHSLFMSAEIGGSVCPRGRSTTGSSRRPNPPRRPCA